MSVYLEPSDTVLKIKQKIYEARGHDIATMDIVMTGYGVLKDNETMEQLQMPDGRTLHEIMRPRYVGA